MSQLESLFDEFNQEEQQQQQQQVVTKKGGEKTSEDTHTKSMLFVRGIPKDATNTELEERWEATEPMPSVRRSRRAATARRPSSCRMVRVVRPMSHSTTMPQPSVPMPALLCASASWSGCSQESGTVLTVDLPRKFVGGPLRGFAFIQMADVDSAQRAISKWNEHELHNRSISVSLAVAKDKFKEMEESGEIEKPEFAEEPAKMEVDEEANEEAEDADADEEKDMDGEDIKDDLVEEGCTLFIRNLSFDSDEDSLFEHFRQFGKLRYCRIVYDHETGRSRGTAFVCFWNAADAAKCLAEAQKAQELSEKLSSVPSATLPDQRNKSVLLQEAPASLEATAQFTLDGRVLSIAKAVDRGTANTLTTEGIKQRQSKDKRNTYLLKEGVIFPDTPAAQALAPADLEHHTRLSVHNIPRSIDEKDLRAAAISAISKFKHEAKEGQRKALTKEEMAEGWDKVAKVVQSKIVCSTDRVDISTGKPRSKGYGFLEFSTHAHALACLRYLNFRNTKQAFAKQLADGKVAEGDNKSLHQISRRSLRVMFSIENAQIIKKRELRAGNDKPARGGVSKQRGGKAGAGKSAGKGAAGGRKDGKKRFNKK
ncbi:RNA-binding domain-containing protein [Linderina pennispora]|uniref:RNA-binding domain-containing protein n=1 Tax=Linderina pennispora TaxID=61395 RepID=A0A1Y1WM96_9FUNG|nr:RNA-binding domain-containing protein [Linderina pennispora]ORX74679.1 RNA-binding domain-containing protein [Linderina pennispora]